MRQVVLSAAAALAVCLFGTAAAGAADEGDYADCAPIADQSLAQERGGFLEAGGVTFDFGVDVKTFVNGELALETALNWPGAGTAAQPLGGANTVSLPGSGGTTTVLQQVTPSAIASYVLNTANNQAVVQNTNISLTLPGFSANQQQYEQQQFAATLAQQLSTSLIRSR